MAALIYEVTWLQLLQLVVGSSSVSMGILLAIFMGGMCLGSLLLPCVISARHHPLRVYGWLELSIGAFGVVLLFAIPWLGRTYAAWGGVGLASILLRAALAGVTLLPPTVAMGATLPAIGRWVDTSPRGVSWLGFFYAGNIAGAVAGSLVAGFVLLPRFDMAVATYAAAGLNLIVGLGALGLAGRSSARHRVPALPVGDVQIAGGGRGAVYWTIALSGFCALSAEVVWTRLLTLRFGATVYSFSIVLAVFLVGLGIGSGTGAWLAGRLAHPRAALGVVQLLVIGAIAWTAFAVTSVGPVSNLVPVWTDPAIVHADTGWTFVTDMGASMLVLLPGPLGWGASFPLALAALAVRGHDPGRLVGRVYAANTVGAIVGALLTTVLLVPSIGSQQSQRLLMVTAGVAGLLALAPNLEGRPAAPRRHRRWVAGSAAVALLAVGWMIFLVRPVPALLVAYGRRAPLVSGSEGEVLYVGEGLHASVAVTRIRDGVVHYHNAGKTQASTLPLDMRLQRLLGHLTTVVPSNPRSVLVIGCGAGVTAGAVSVDPAVERVTIAEIEPLVPRVARDYFGSVNHAVIDSPKTRLVIDDARHFLQTTDETFDAITSDPLDPWVKGSAALYTREFFQLARRRLNAGGVMTLFVQLYDSDVETVKSELATFFEVFPEATVWANVHEGFVEDMVLLGPVDSVWFDLDALEARWRRPEFAPVARSLREIEIYGPIDLFGNYAGRAADLRPWLADASLNLDRNLRLQYLAGLAIDRRDSGRIYSQIAAYRRFPDDVFLGSDELLSRLQAAMGQTPE